MGLSLFCGCPFFGTASKGKPKGTTLAPKMRLRHMSPNRIGWDRLGAEGLPWVPGPHCEVQQRREHRALGLDQRQACESVFGRAELRICGVLVGWLVGRSVGGSVGRSVGRQAGWPAVVVVVVEVASCSCRGNMRAFIRGNSHKRGKCEHKLEVVDP